MLKLLDISEICFTQLIQFTDWESGWKILLNNLKARWKKSKKVSESWKWTFHKGQYSKPSNINVTSVSELFRKKFVEFTDLTHTIYWPINIA